MKFKMKRISKLRTIALSLMMVAFLSISTFSNAQEGGLFGYGNYDKSQDYNYGMTNRGMININDNGETGIVNQTFGDTAPLGGGLLIMLVASAGYMMLKKKED